MPLEAYARGLWGFYGASDGEYGGSRLVIFEYELPICLGESVEGCVV